MRQSWESQMIDGVFPTKATDEGLFKMSVKELVLKDEVGNSLNFKDAYGGVLMTIDDRNSIKKAYLDRNQAHLLYLYLKERFEP